MGSMVVGRASNVEMGDQGTMDTMVNGLTAWAKRPSGREPATRKTSRLFKIEAKDVREVRYYTVGRV